MGRAADDVDEDELVEPLPKAFSLFLSKGFSYGFSIIPFEWNENYYFYFTSLKGCIGYGCDIVISIDNKKNAKETFLNKQYRCSYDEGKHREETCRSMELCRVHT